MLRFRSSSTVPSSKRPTLQIKQHMNVALSCVPEPFEGSLWESSFFERGRFFVRYDISPFSVQLDVLRLASQLDVLR
jgi:hypothetical protein